MRTIKEISADIDAADKRLSDSIADLNNEQQANAQLSVTKLIELHLERDVVFAQQPEKCQNT